MGKQTSKPSAAQKARGKKQVVVSDGVRVVMAGLTQAEKDTIESAFKSAAALQRLPVDLVVAAESGNMYTAHITDNLRLIYQIHPDRVEVIDLLSAGAVQYLLHPDRVSSKHARADAKK